MGARIQMPATQAHFNLAFRCQSAYSNYIKTIELKITRIGNSKGIRLPAGIIRRYKLDGAVLLEQRPDELALRPKKAKKLSWAETYHQMAAAKEDLSDLNATIADGLE
jgi:antitoxin MazE